MRRGNGGLRRKGITSLSIITTPVIILGTTLCVLFFQQEGPSLFGYVASGSSFYFPSIPFINLLGFLPEDIHILPFTVGNLVDVIVDVYMILTVGIVPYRCHKSAREPGIPFKDVFRAIQRERDDCTTNTCPSMSGLVGCSMLRQGKKVMDRPGDRMQAPGIIGMSRRSHGGSFKHGDARATTRQVKGIEPVPAPTTTSTPTRFGSNRSRSSVPSFHPRFRACPHASHDALVPARIALTTIVKSLMQTSIYKEIEQCQQI